MDFKKYFSLILFFVLGVFVGGFLPFSGNNQNFTARTLDSTNDIYPTKSTTTTTTTTPTITPTSTTYTGTTTTNPPVVTSNRSSDEESTTIGGVINNISSQSQVVSEGGSGSNDLTYACNGLPACQVGYACCVSGGPSTGYTVNGNGSGSCEGTLGSVGQIGGTCTIGRYMANSSSIASDSSVLFKNILKFGMKGEEVKKLQGILYSLGFMDSKYQTGYFGNITLGAVKNFQNSKNLTPDGVVGPITQKQMNMDFGDIPMMSNGAIDLPQ